MSSVPDPTPFEVEGLSEFLQSENQPDFIMLICVLVFYGIYTMLVALYIYLQIQQRGRKHYCQLAVLLLYMLATAQIVVTILDYNQETLINFTLFLSNFSAFSEPVAAHFDTSANLEIVEAAIYVIANFVADSLLIYRCYIVWGARKYITAGPSLLSFANTALALSTIALQHQAIPQYFELFADGVESASVDAANAITIAFLAVNIFTNVVVTGLIAGRIFWIYQTNQQSLGAAGRDDKSLKTLNMIVAMILESGLLYPVALGIGLWVDVGTFVDTVEPILTVAVGMTPTLIMVRTDLDISVRIHPNEDLIVSSLRYDQAMTQSYNQPQP
ncbi:hypothetical protein BDP27DRAFT_1340523 [Rhodocollybia butyracea]|uniref:Uncharacterized protein n=1 Tax=Rhodocollybia butyracea TaxID=206335 RepID=A0A9P5PD01_9AGAR|nr:hypothetical protein BDP27DRAFT_1340523 [Rhodocollybia butyracea]